MKKYFFAVTLLALSSLVIAETAAGANPAKQREEAAALKTKMVDEASRNPLSSTACAFNFTSGHANGFIKYCVSGNGNIVQFESPEGVPLVSQADLGEGYGVCDLGTSSDTGAGVAYTDYGGAGDSGNWGPATVVSHSAKSVKIVRTTSDGNWTLTQIITTVGGTLVGAKIEMDLTNNSPDTRLAVLVRYTDLDADGSLQNNFDGTANSAVGWNSISNVGIHPYGLALQILGSLPFESSGLPLNIPRPPDPCSPGDHFSRELVTATDGALATYYAPVVKAHKTAKMTVAYRPW